MIEPLSKSEPYPARLPPLRTQWLRVHRWARYAIVGIPLVLVAVLCTVNIDIGVVAAVMAAGVGAASMVYVKNRTDRHNAAVDRGEIRVVADPHLQRIPVATLDVALLDRLDALGQTTGDIGHVIRFDGGWIVKGRNLRAISLVIGDDGEWAHFDPTRVDDLRAASEYRAGRGREPADS